MCYSSQKEKKTKHNKIHSYSQAWHCFQCRNFGRDSTALRKKILKKKHLHATLLNASLLLNNFFFCGNWEMVKASFPLNFVINLLICPSLHKFQKSHLWDQGGCGIFPLYQWDAQELFNLPREVIHYNNCNIFLVNKSSSVKIMDAEKQKWVMNTWSGCYFWQSPVQ